MSRAWLETNVALFKHVLDYEAKLEKFLNKTRGWIREQEECIWTKMFEITGDAGTPLCTSLDIMLCLLDTLPSFPANLSYQSNLPIICGFAPEAYAQPWLGLHGMDLTCLPSFENCKKATGCFEGSYYPEYRRWYSLQSEGRSVCLYLHRTHTDRERCQCTPAHFFLCGLLSIQMQMQAKSPSPQRSQSDTSSNEGSASGQESKGSHSSSSSSSRSSSESGSSSGSHVKGPQLDLRPVQV